MAKARLIHALRGAALLALGLVVAAPAAPAVPKPGARRALTLFSGFLGRMNVNQWDCGLDATGHVCVDPNGSTTVGGGYWPQLPDQYVFGSGLQVAGVVNPSIAGFEWAGDTTAAFFEDPSGQHENGRPLSAIWQSTDVADFASWPRDAYVPFDNALYNPVLQGAKKASQEDVWTRYWDGDPGFNAGRPHPLGILVNQRGMAWNFPSGNEAIQYWIYTITNITASATQVYAGRPDQDSLTRLGQRFQAANNSSFNVHIPDTGYTIVNVYVAFAMDADVSVNARQNFTTASLPFNMGIAFKSNWFAPEFVYPSTVFSPPFAPTVGEVGVKYLRSPVDPGTGQEVGLTLYSGTVNNGAFGDAVDAKQVYRYFSGTLDPSKGDAPCNYPLQPGQTRVQAHVCYIPTTPDDIRFFQSSGPLTLKPGESQSIVVAYIAAAPVNHPAIAARSAALVFPTGGPFPVQPNTLVNGVLSPLDTILGALSVVGDTGGAPTGGPNGKIDQNEIRVTPRSLLGKGLVAQAVFDAKFLLPFAPDAPDFFLIPGDDQVTVVWKASPTDVLGDPYFAVASDVTSPLYDPNYRRFDVEGYRIYRGRLSGDLKMIAQFDKAGTTFIDYTGELSSPDCAPELGVTTGCPVPFAAAPPYTVSDTVPLAGDIIQIPPGGRAKLADGSIIVLQADTAVTGGGSGFAKLTDTGVPFAYVDHGAKNGFTYFYTVAAFDVNSVKSTGVGSTSLEGKLPAKTVVPRKTSAQVSQGQLTLSLVGAGGALLSKGAVPALDKATGIFAGPMPPTDGFALGFPAFLPAVVTSDSVTVTIDSVVAGNPDPDGLGTGGPPVYYMRAQGPTGTVSLAVPLAIGPTDEDATASALLPRIPFDQTLARVFGGDATYALLPQLGMSASGTWRLASWGRASANADPAGDFNGPRWWAGAANENTPDPNGLHCSPAAGGCVQTNLGRNAGAIAGVGIFHIQGYSTVNSQPQRDLEAIGASVYRAADLKVYWGATPGNVDSVVDATHKVKMAFRSSMGPTWGFLTDQSFAAVVAANTPDKNNAILTWTDIFCVDPAPAFLAPRGDACFASAPLQNHATLSPVIFKGHSYATVPTDTAYMNNPTGNGFIFYINGHFFLMQLAALPASTVWNARFYAGNITGTPGSYAFESHIRPPAVPGLTVKASFSSTTFTAAKTTDSALAKIHTVPDPYYVTNQFEQSPESKILKFVNLPSQCIIRIYSLSGILVRVITLNDATGGSEVEWNLRNRNEQFVASGVYFYHVETPDGKSKIGRFTVVNFAK
jgi:hypothetical protein